MKLPIYYVDAFTDNLFSGNPAAVIFSDLNDDSLMRFLKYYRRFNPDTSLYSLCGDDTEMNHFFH